MFARIVRCPNKNYWYYPLVGELIELTGEKWVDDGLHERAFVPGVDDQVPLSEIGYSTMFSGEVCATDIQII